MQRAVRLRRSADYASVQRRGRVSSNQLLTLRALPNESTISRFGFLVSKRVGNAVVRNRARRQLREICRVEPVAGGWDLVLIARPSVAETPFATTRDAVRELFRRGNVYTPPPVKPAKGASR